MKTIQIYDPALCCSTGVCGVDVDQVLVTFSAEKVTRSLDASGNVQDAQSAIESLPSVASGFRHSMPE